MEDKFLKFVQENRLFNPSDRILLAVSGGIDSMVMLHLFIKNKLNIGIAHCNFKLRGDESENDENFVKQNAHSNNIQFYSTQFNTAEYSKKEGVSIQMVARELRYSWLVDIARKHNFNFIAIGHNQDDIVETFLINLSRGTGIKGLTGIEAKRGMIIRPLLFASRKQIEKYALEHQINFREDSSNISTKYHRNKLRHKIIPEFQKINPLFSEKVIHTIKILQELDQILKPEINEIIKKITIKQKEQLLINISNLKKQKAPKLILFEILSSKGFNSDQVEDVLQTLKSQPGQQFYSPTHRLVKDRTHLILCKIRKEEINEIIIDKEIKNISFPIRLNIKKIENNSNFKLSEKSSIATLDYDKLKFPLKLRKWKTGDKFMPLGMKNFKKLSDYFSDNKFSLIDKENTWLLISDNQIVWIVNHRIDERYKITSLTKNILKIENAR